MNLIFADVVIAAYGIPVDFTAALNYGWKMGRDMCYSSGFLLTMCGNSILEN